jgi:hypothetical protein
LDLPSLNRVIGHKNLVGMIKPLHGIIFMQLKKKKMQKTRRDFAANLLQDAMTDLLLCKSASTRLGAKYGLETRLVNDRLSVLLELMTMVDRYHHSMDLTIL